MPAPLRDLNSIETFPILDKKGTLKRAEMEITSVMPNDHGSNVFYRGFLADETPVRTFYMSLAPVPFIPDHTSEEQVPIVLARQLNDALAMYPARGDVLPVYWFSPTLLPRIWKNERWVDSLTDPLIRGGDSLQLVSPPLFRKRTFTAHECEAYTIQMLTIIPDKSGKTILEEMFLRERGDSLDILRKHASRFYSHDFSPVSSSSHTLETRIEHASRRSSGKSDEALQFLLANRDKFAQFDISFGVASYFDVEAFLARSLMRNARTVERQYAMYEFVLSSFNQTQSDFYNEFKKEMSRIFCAIPPASLLTPQETVTLLKSSANYVLKDIISESVTMLDQNFGGGERRKIR